MNDERINAKLSIIKRNNLFIISIVSLFVLLMKLAFKLEFVNFLTELYLFSGTSIVLLISFISNISSEVQDERVIQRTNRIYDVGFWFITLSGILLYFITLLFYDTNSIGIGFTPNVSINTIILICVVLSFILIRINKMTFNHRIIELDTKEYYCSVLKRIAYLFFYYLIVGIIVNVILLFKENIQMTAIVISFAVGVSFITLAIQYFIFSIYEKIHYDESVERDEGKYRYVTKKVMLLFILNFAFALANLIVSFTASYLNNDVFDLSPFMINLQIFLSLASTLFFKIASIDFIILTLLMDILILGSLKKIDFTYKRLFSFFKVAIFVNFVFALVFWAYSIYMEFTIFTDLSTVRTIAAISNYLSYIFLAFTLAVSILIIIFFNKNDLKKESTIYIISTILSTFVILSRFILFDRIYIYEAVLTNNLINIISKAVTGVLSIVIIHSLNRRIQIVKIDEELQQSI